MFCLMQKLHAVKVALKRWAAQLNAKKSKEEDQIQHDIGDIQSQMQASPNNLNLFAADRQLKEQLMIQNVQEESTLKYKSPYMRMSLGDSNSKYFYNLMRIRRRKNSILSLRDARGHELQGDAMEKEAIAYFQSVFAPTP